MLPFPVPHGMLEPLNHHPCENQNGFEHADEPLNRIGSVPKIDPDLAEQGVKPVVMFTAERNGKPRDVVLAADMVRFNPLGAAADYAFADSL
jgi:hypothetical protein